MFYYNLDKRSKKAMIEYLSGHFRYFTMNSWNRSRSYAHNLKIYSLGLDSETQQRLYALIQCEDFYDSINQLIYDFSAAHGGLWQAGFNGRSGGYLVLYQGGIEPSGYKCVFPGRGTDDYGDFADWDISKLRGRVELVQCFDKLADAIVAEAVYLAGEYEAREEQYSCIKTRLVLVAREA